MSLPERPANVLKEGKEGKDRRRLVSITRVADQNSVPQEITIVKDLDSFGLLNSSGYQNSGDRRSGTWARKFDSHSSDMNEWTPSQSKMKKIKFEWTLDESPDDSSRPQEASDVSSHDVNGKAINDSSRLDDTTDIFPDLYGSSDISPNISDSSDISSPAPGFDRGKRSRSSGVLGDGGHSSDDKGQRSDSYATQAVASERNGDGVSVADVKIELESDEERVATGAMPRLPSFSQLSQSLIKMREGSCSSASKKRRLSGPVCVSPKQRSALTKQQRLILPKSPQVFSNPESTLHKQGSVKQQEAGNPSPNTPIGGKKGSDTFPPETGRPEGEICDGNPRVVMERVCEKLLPRSSSVSACVMGDMSLPPSSSSFSSSSSSALASASASAVLPKHVVDQLLSRDGCKTRSTSSLVVGGTSLSLSSSSSSASAVLSKYVVDQLVSQDSGGTVSASSHVEGSASLSPSSSSASASAVLPKHVVDQLLSRDSGRTLSAGGLNSLKGTNCLYFLEVSTRPTPQAQSKKPHSGLPLHADVASSQSFAKQRNLTPAPLDTTPLNNGGGVSVVISDKEKSIFVKKKTPVIIKEQSPIVVIQKLPPVVKDKSLSVEESSPPVVIKEKAPIVIKEKSPIVIKEKSHVVDKAKSPVVNKEKSPLTTVKEKSPDVNKEKSTLITVKEKSPVVNKEKSPLTTVKEKSPDVNKDKSPLITVTEKSPVVKEKSPLVTVKENSSNVKENSSILSQGSSTAVGEKSSILKRKASVTEEESMKSRLTRARNSEPPLKRSVRLSAKSNVTAARERRREVGKALERRRNHPLRLAAKKKLQVKLKFQRGDGRGQPGQWISLLRDVHTRKDLKKGTGSGKQRKLANDKLRSSNEGNVISSCARNRKDVTAEVDIVEHAVSTSVSGTGGSKDISASKSPQGSKDISLSNSAKDVCLAKGNGNRETSVSLNDVMMEHEGSKDLEVLQDASDSSQLPFPPPPPPPPLPLSPSVTTTLREEEKVELQLSSSSQEKRKRSRVGRLVDKGFMETASSKEKVIISPPSSLAWVNSAGKAILAPVVRHGIDQLVSKGCSQVYLEMNSTNQCYKVCTKSKPFKLLLVGRSLNRGSAHKSPSASRSVNVGEQTVNKNESGELASKDCQRVNGDKSGELSKKDCRTVNAKNSREFRQKGRPRKNKKKSGALAKKGLPTENANKSGQSTDTGTQTMISNESGESSDGDTGPCAVAPTSVVAKDNDCLSDQPQTLPETQVVEEERQGPSSGGALQKPLKEWSHADVADWLERLNLLWVLPDFRQVDGPSMVELVSGFTLNSSLIMQYLKEMGLSLAENLRMCAALRALADSPLHTLPKMASS
ncbi:uncharacterized protein LOC101851202 isoform X2 [Aplysia californica]|nr:uncharacterized protein LOC101851202 isoform X2 [Aplysia californica]